MQVASGGGNTITQHESTKNANSTNHTYDYINDILPVSQEIYITQVCQIQVSERKISTINWQVNFCDTLTKCDTEKLPFMKVKGSDTGNVALSIRADSDFKA